MSLSYQALARRWRPQIYADVVGQQHVLAALASSCAHNRLHHAYLFSGSRGVGKTTLARLFAKGLNCANGITATPCGNCGACQDIEQGRFVDLLEIDAASRTKVEDTRELLDNIQYLPAHGRFKIYLIDEVHMLSRHSFNALLKTLEEPPSHVKFLLATTDPQKLPVTVLSRCLQFHLQLLSIEKIQTHLQKVLQSEKITAEPEALLLLARAARGSLRDALSLTDQAIAIGQGVITTVIVSQMLGILDIQLALALVEELQRADAAALMQIVEQVFTQGGNGEQLLSDMASILHQIAMRQWLSRGDTDTLTVGVKDEQTPEVARIEALACLITPQDLQLYYQTVLIGRKELPLAPDQRMGVEMTLLRALAFHPNAEVSPPRMHTVAAAAVDFASPEVSMPEPQEIVPPQPASTIATGEEQSQPIEPVESTEMVQLLQIREQLRQQQRQVHQARIKRGSNITTTTTRTMTALPALTQTITPPMPAVQQSSIEIPSAVPAPQTSAEQSPAVERLALATRLAKEAALRDEWSAEIARLTLPKLVEQLALNSVRELRAPGQIVLHLCKAQRHLNGPSAQAALAKALSRAAGHPVAVTILERDDQDGEKWSDPTRRTPLEWRQAIYQEQLTVAHQALLNDENIQRLQRDFAAQLDETSIQLP